MASTVERKRNGASREYWSLESTADAMLAKHREQWTREISPLVEQARFHRGFVESVTIDAHSFVTHGARLYGSGGNQIAGCSDDALPREWVCELPSIPVSSARSRSPVTSSSWGDIRAQHEGLHVSNLLVSPGRGRPPEAQSHRYGVRDRAGAASSQPSA